jgi:hypothetical protein
MWGYKLVKILDFREVGDNLRKMHQNLLYFKNRRSQIYSNNVFTLCGVAKYVHKWSQLYVHKVYISIFVYATSLHSFIYLLIQPSRLKHFVITVTNLDDSYKRQNTKE